MQQMNTKAKKIITAYKKALKHAHKPESRVRLMLIGDAGSGESTLLVLHGPISVFAQMVW